MDDTTLLEVQTDGAILLPAALRERYGIVAGESLVCEATDNGILLRSAAPAATTSAAVDDDGEGQTAAERHAATLLTEAVSEDEYARAVEEVRGMGLDPDTVTRSAAGE